MAVEFMAVFTQVRRSRCVLVPHGQDTSIVLVDLLVLSNVQSLARGFSVAVQGHCVCGVYVCVLYVTEPY